MLTKEKRGKLEQEVLEELEKTFSLPKDIHKLSSRFISWCKKNKLDAREQTMSGRNFRKFKREAELNYQKLMRRAKELVSLIKFEQPLAMSFEHCWEIFSIDGWNRCILVAIKTGIIPRETNVSKDEIPAKRAFGAGSNEARKKLMNKKFDHLLRKE